MGLTRGRGLRPRRTWASWEAPGAWAGSPVICGAPDLASLGAAGRSRSRVRGAVQPCMRCGGVSPEHGDEQESCIPDAGSAPLWLSQSAHQQFWDLGVHTLSPGCRPPEQGAPLPAGSLLAGSCVGRGHGEAGLTLMVRSLFLESCGLASTALRDSSGGQAPAEHPAP